jgi:cyclopropane-fatty-acyl-phospholipid synthase
MLLSRLLKSAIRVGTLTIVDASGRSHRFPASPEPEVTVRLHKKSLEYQLYLNPDLALGEAWMSGALTIEQGTLRDLFHIVMDASMIADADLLYAFRARIWKALRGFHQNNPIRRSQRNVAHHYDLPDELYEMFLDPDRQYSCAYFESATDDLATAQEAKKRHIAAKMLLEPGLKILDIGSGWGGLSRHLADVSGAHVTGLTLSESQLQHAQRTAAENGRVAFRLRDYRQETRVYDRVVSVGMFEHVGSRNFETYFDTIGRLLTDDGVALIHTIGRQSGPGSTSPWIRKYIFPGGYAPALSEIMQAVEKSGLWLNDIEPLRLHYAYTLRAWQKAFARHRLQIAALLDEQFCRMWEYYLVASEASFLYGDHLVFQLQLSKRRDVVPLRRDYIQAEESVLQADAPQNRKMRVI